MDIVSRIGRGRRRLAPSQVIELRSKWKLKFEEYILGNYRRKLREDLIIRDVRRFDVLPMFSTVRADR